MKRNPHFFHKLNMLAPGCIMTALSVLFLFVGGILWLCTLTVAARICFGVAGVLFGSLLVLVAIELRQDRILNEAAIRENERLEKDAADHPWRKNRRP